jgi:hypothetical protein
VSTTPKVQVLSKQLAMIDGFLVDCLLDSDHTFDSEITDNPIEDGSNPSDNIQNKPLIVTMECVVSNTPIGQLADLRDKVSEPGDDCYEHLLGVRNAREPVTIRTALRTFANMGLKHLSIPQRSGRGDELRFTVTFKELDIRKNNRTTRVAVPMAKGPSKENKPAKPSNIVNRSVDKFDGTWFDPDIDGWREGASYNATKGHWEFFKGRPIHVPREDWQLKPHLTDAQYKAMNDGPIAKFKPAPDGKGFLPVDSAGNRIEIVTDPAAIDAARKAGVTDQFGNKLE